jgi:hypothetical protein
MDLIDNPPPPTKAMKQLMADRRKRLARGEKC